MFIYYYVQLDMPFLDAWDRLSDAMNEVGSWATDAYRDGEVLYARAGPAGSRIAKNIEIRVHDASVGDATVTIPMVWTATGSSGLFPKMEADLIVGSIGPDVTQVSLRGTYTPPLGSVGRALDRLLLHRVAEATIKSFVDRIADAMASQRSAAANV